MVANNPSYIGLLEVFRDMKFDFPDVTHKVSVCIVIGDALFPHFHRLHEVRMLDQVIVAGAGSVSFSEQWLIYTKKLSVLIHPTRLAFSNTADGDTRSAL